MRQGVILYGPPASGKDTVTDALIELDSRYARFLRLKVGSGKTDGYRMGTAQQLAQLEGVGDVIYANSRYGNTYVVDRPGLTQAFDGGIPVVHLGQIDGIRAVLDGYAAGWVTVLLWNPREITEFRSKARNDRDTPARLAAWDATLEDLDSHANMIWDLTVPTVTTKPAETARLIDELLAERKVAT
jgi:guanylate kinase